jgi:hypothetical protein
MAETMHFGKYKGTPVDQVPTGYLMWCTETLDRCPAQVLEEVARRLAEEPLPESVPARKCFRQKKGRRFVKQWAK